MWKSIFLARAHARLHQSVWWVALCRAGPGSLITGLWCSFYPHGLLSVVHEL